MGTELKETKKEVTDQKGVRRVHKKESFQCAKERDQLDFLKNHDDL
jgi:hypothetical protein